MTAADIIADVQANLNDPSGTLFATADLLPYLQIAIRDLEAQLLSNDIQLLETFSAEFTIPAGDIDMGSNQPADLVVPERMMERMVGSVLPEDFIMMQRVRTIPQETQNELLRYWNFTNNLIGFLGATADRSVLLYYKHLITNVTSDSDDVIYLQSQNYLGYRTAALAALRMGEDQERADRLNMDADKSMELILAIAVKDAQSAPTRMKRYSSKFKQGYRRLI